MSPDPSPDEQTPPGAAGAGASQQLKARLSAQFREYLESKGRKITSERRIILDMVTEMVGGLIAADDLIDRAREQNNRVSKATVYRILPLLVEAGVLYEHRFTQNKAYYQLVTPGAPRAHLICLQCGKIQDYNDQAIETIRDDACRMLDFDPTYHHLQVFGICSQCRLRGDADPVSGFDPRDHPIWRMRHLR